MTTPIGSLYWFAFIVFETWRNWYLIAKKQKRPNYSASRRFRIFAGLVGIPITYPLFDPFGYPYTILGAVLVGVFEWSSFYLFFDPGLSLLRRRPWNHQGKDSGPLDRLPKGKYYALKVFCLLLFVFCIVNSFYHFI